MQLDLQADAQQALAGFVVQLAADAAALHFLHVQHVLGQAADLLFALGQIFHQARFLGGHQAAFGGGRQQFLLAREPFVGFFENPNCITPAVRPSAASGIDQQDWKRLCQLSSSRTPAECASPLR